MNSISPCTCCMDKDEFSIVKGFLSWNWYPGGILKETQLGANAKFESGVPYIKKECKETVMRKGGVVMLKT